MVTILVAKAAIIVKDTCPDTCPCCNSGNQTFEHWLLEYPMFNYHRSKYLCLTDTSLNNFNLNTNDNLLNDNSNYNRNSNVENRTENNIYNSSANNIIDHLQSLFNRHRKTDLTKRVNAENAVRQSSRDSAINNNDNNFVT